jgi:hypothetical protein
MIKVDEMKKSVCVFILFFLTFYGFAVQYSDDYFGLSLEFQKADFIKSFESKEYFKSDTISFIFTYGPSFSGPVRFQIGAGVHELSDYYLNGGIELRVLEFLNTVKGRIFGLYLNADLKMGLDYVETAVKGKIFIPFSAVGGLQIGLGVNHNIEPLFSIAYSGGVYPLQTK